MATTLTFPGVTYGHDDCVQNRLLDQISEKVSSGTPRALKASGNILGSEFMTSPVMLFLNLSYMPGSRLVLCEGIHSHSGGRGPRRGSWTVSSPVSEL